MRNPQKVQAWTYGIDDDGQPGLVTMIQSSECPANSFSKVRVDREGRVKEFVDCRNTNLEELALNAGVQGNILDQASTPTKSNLAISGGGYFVTHCEDGYHLSRYGAFTKDQGQLMQNGCVLQTADGSPFQVSAKPSVGSDATPGANFDSSSGDHSGGDMIGEADDGLDEYGCKIDGTCLAVVHPENPQSVSYIDSGTLKALTNPFLHPVKGARVFQNAIEADVLKNAPGSDWQAIPEFKLPDCEKLLAR